MICVTKRRKADDEAYYNFALTPVISLPLHARYVNFADPAKGQALVNGSRLQDDRLRTVRNSLLNMGLGEISCQELNEV